MLWNSCRICRTPAPAKSARKTCAIGSAITGWKTDRLGKLREESGLTDKWVAVKECDLNAGVDGSSDELRHLGGIAAMQIDI